MEKAEISKNLQRIFEAFRNSMNYVTLAWF